MGFVNDELKDLYPWLANERQVFVTDESDK